MSSQLLVRGQPATSTHLKLRRQLESEQFWSISKERS